MVSLSRASKVAAILAVSGLGLGACSAHPGTAAIVGDWTRAAKQNWTCPVSSSAH